MKLVTENWPHNYLEESDEDIKNGAVTEIPVFRVFVSSTFNDFKAERDALQKSVFPKLQELCYKLGCRFQAIDLRWGVNEEATYNHLAMEICLKELERCQMITARPNLIVLLGNRYGWQPLPTRIKADEFLEIMAIVSPDEQQLLCEQENSAETYSGWYQKDDNAVPPEYRLKPRQLFIPSDISSEEKEKIKENEAQEWLKIEKRIRKIFSSAIERLGWPLGDPRRVKYCASATHQEIIAGALNAKNPESHVFCFFKECGGLAQENSIANMDNDDNNEGETDRWLHTLKKQLIELLPNNTFIYSIADDVKHAIDYVGDLTAETARIPENLDEIQCGPTTLCMDVWKTLSWTIIQEMKHIKPSAPLENEVKEHQLFSKTTAAFFVGREAVRKRIKNYIFKGNNHPLVIVGEPGSGKSALMSKAVMETIETQKFLVFYRFIGVTPNSTDIRLLLKNLCYHIAPSFQQHELSFPDNFWELTRKFAQILSLANKKKPIVLFLDALDQLADSENARQLAWLPSLLPPYVRLIVSVAKPPDQVDDDTDYSCFKIIKTLTPTDNILAIPPMTYQEGAELLTSWLTHASPPRTLTPKQQETILNRFTIHGSPLWLRIAFEESRRWPSFYLFSAHGSSDYILEEDIEGMILGFFTRLATASGHGKIFVERSLAYLAAARYGLGDNELLEILSTDAHVMTEFKSQSQQKPIPETLPVVIWSRLYADLEPFLAMRNANGNLVMNFFHHTFKQVIQKNYSAGILSFPGIHQHLARYFGAQPSWFETSGQRIPNIRKLSELPYQQIRGILTKEDQHQVVATLCNIDFINAKCQAGLIYDLIYDFIHAEKMAPFPIADEHEEESNSTTFLNKIKKWNNTIFKNKAVVKKDTYTIMDSELYLQTWKNFIKANLSFLIMGNISIFQLAYNFSATGIIAKQTAQIAAEKEQQQIVWLRMINRPPISLPSECELVIDISESESKTPSIFLYPDGKYVVTGEPGGLLRFRNMASGECVNTIKVDSINKFAFTPDGKRVVIVKGDNTLKVLDLEKWHPLLPFDEHLKERDITWNKYETLKQQKMKQEEAEAIRIEAEREAGNIFPSLYASLFKTPKLVDDSIISDSELYKDDLARINTIAITVDGRYAFTGGGDAMLRAWNLQAGQCIFATALDNISHSSSIDILNNVIRKILINTSGTRAITFQDDRQLCLWNLETKTLLKRIPVQRDYTIHQFTFSEDWRYALVTGDYIYSRPFLMPHKWRFSRFKKKLTGQYRRNPEFAEMMERADIMLDTLKSVNRIKSRGFIGLLDTQSGIIKRFKGEINILEEKAFNIFNPLAMSCNGKWAISGDENGMLHLWKVDEGICIKRFPGHVNSIRTVALTPDSERAISIGADRTLRVWNLKDKVPHKDIKTPVIQEKSKAIHSVAFFAAGILAISASMNRSCFWETETGKCTVDSGPWEEDIHSLAISMAGNYAIYSYGKNKLQVWNLFEAKILITHELEKSNSCYHLRVTLDSRFIVYTELWDLYVRDICTGAVVNTLAGNPRSTDDILATKPFFSQFTDVTRDMSGYGNSRQLFGKVNDIALMPDGHRVIVAANGVGLLLWDFQTNHHNIFKSDYSYSTAVAVTPDGVCAVSGDCYNNLLLWDIESRKCFKTIPAHQNEITAIAITADGLYAVSGSKDRMVCIWDLQTGTCVARHISFGGGITCLDIHFPYIVAGTQSGKVDFLKIENLPAPRVSIITAHRLWRLDGKKKNIINPSSNNPDKEVLSGQWADELRGLCPSCHIPFFLPQSHLGQIVVCPNRECGKYLKINPFVCDNKGFI